MNLSQLKNILQTLEKIQFRLENGNSIPEHFHITEVGKIDKNYIDCGGTVRKETFINFQIWCANDFEHRLKPNKLLNIIELSENTLNLPDSEIEVEYQSHTIGKYSLDFDGTFFVLKNKSTNCLAQDMCGITPTKKKIQLSQLNKNSCKPNSSCC